MTDWVAFRLEIEAVHQKLKSTKKPLPDKEAQKFFSAVCTTFREATPEDRVDLQIAFEDRDLVLTSFTAYLNKLAQSAAQAAGRGKDEIALAALQDGFIADAIIDGRSDLHELHRAQNHLAEAARDLGFNFEDYLKPFETPPLVYVRRAYRLNQSGDRVQAIRTLGRALQLDPHLQTNAKVADFAAELTGDSARTALLTLSDSFMRNQLANEIRNPPKTLYQKELKPNSDERPVYQVPASQGKLIRLPGLSVQVFVGVVFLYVIGRWLYGECHRLFGRFHNMHGDFNWFMAFLGVASFVVAFMAFYSRNLVIRYRFSHFSAPMTFKFRGSQAVVLGIGYVACGLISLGTAANELQWIQMTGELERFLSASTTFMFVVAFSLVTMLISQAVPE